MIMRLLTKRDIPLIMSLEKNNAPDTPLYSQYTKNDLNYLFDNPKTSLAVGMFDEDRLVAWGSYRTNWHRHSNEEGMSEISSIVVDKNYRRKGLGSKMLSELLKHIKDNDFNKIFLTVSPLNVDALQFYLSKGFIIYDFKEGVYEDRGSDRLYLILQ